MVRAGGLLVAVWTIGMVVLVSSAGGCGGKTSGPGGTASDGAVGNGLERRRERARRR